MHDLDLDEAVIAVAAAAHRAGATVCPSDVAREVGGDDEDVWRPLLQPVRDAAARLARLGVVEVLQGGVVVVVADARGPIRLRLRRR